MIELPVQVINGNAHHKDRHKNIEQHAQLHQKMHAAHQHQTQQKNPILQSQIAQNLGERLAPSGDHKKASEYCE